jgi:HD-like signal output (HDOD) protein
MNDDILAQIDSLPPLPQTVIYIDEFKRKEDKSPNELAQIIGKDPLILSTLLKVSNSAMFGFKKKIETPQMAVSLLGVNFTISLALGSAIKNLVETSLEPYGANSDKFLEVASQAVIMSSRWSTTIDIDLKDRLVLPTFLLEIGKFIIARVLKNKNLSQQFYEEVKHSTNIAEVERKYIGASTSTVTAAIFERWGLSETLISDIKYVDEPSNPNNQSLIVSQIIHVVNKVCNIVAPFQEEAIQSALQYAQDASLKHNELAEVIQSMKEKYEG